MRSQLLTNTKSFKHENIICTFIVILNWLVYFLVGNSDRENYGTTLLPFTRNDSPRPSFLGVPFGDLHLAFGTEFPLLSEIQPLLPFSLIHFLGLAPTFIIIISSINILIIKKYFKTLQIFKINIGKWHSAIAILLIFSPGILDSFYFNDWPGTHFSVQFTILAFLQTMQVKTSLIKRRESWILIIFLSIAFLSDPGYAPISFIGVLLIYFICKKSSQSTEIPKRENYFFLSLIFITLAILYSLKIINNYEIFINKNRISPFDNLEQNKLSKLFGLSGLDYMPRTCWIIVPVALVYVSARYFLRSHEKHNSLIISSKLSLLIIFITCGMTLISYSLAYKLIITPTGIFFFRDIAYFLFLILLSQSIQSCLKTSIINSRINLVDCFIICIFITSLSITMFMKFDQKVELNSKSWLSNKIFNQTGINKFNLTPPGSRNAVGIAFTNTAYQQVRNGVTDSIWMPTDLLDSRIRLLTAVTKIQPKDSIFSSPNGIFQASTVSDINWCLEVNKNKYWVDYVVFGNNENVPQECGDNSFIVDNLKLVRVNSHLGIYNISIEPSINNYSYSPTTGNCVVKEYAHDNYLELAFSNCKIGTKEKHSVTLPFLNFRNLTIVNSNQDILSLDSENRFMKIDISNSEELKLLRFTMSPSWNTKFSVILLWILNLYFHFRVFKYILARFKYES